MLFHIKLNRSSLLLGPVKMYVIFLFIVAESSASSLLEKMREDGFTLKQSMLGKLTDPKAANEVCSRVHVLCQTILSFTKCLLSPYI